MPYVEIDSFETPSMDTSIWRYMDFMKFANLIAEQNMFLCTPEKLGDPFEGKMPESNRKAIHQSKNQSIPCDVMLGVVDAAFKNIGHNVYINCWHMNDYESDAMWKIYALNNAGIAIKTTIGKLIDSMKYCEEKVHIGKVNYIDYVKNDPVSFNPFGLYTYKDKSYEHEKEVRSVFVLMNGMKVKKEGVGVKIPINVSDLIEEVYLSPTAPDWVVRTVGSVMKSYGLDRPLIRSRLLG